MFPKFYFNTFFLVFFRLADIAVPCSSYLPLQKSQRLLLKPLVSAPPTGTASRPPYLLPSPSYSFERESPPPFFFSRPVCSCFRQLALLASRSRALSLSVYDRFVNRPKRTSALCLFNPFTSIRVSYPSFKENSGAFSLVCEAFLRRYGASV